MIVVFITKLLNYLVYRWKKRVEEKFQDYTIHRSKFLLKSHG